MISSLTGRVLMIALGLAFLGLAFTSESNRWFGQSAYLLSAAGLVVVARQTRQLLPPPHRWAAQAALGGLVATELFAATELAVVPADEWQGVGALIVPSWLFAAVGWVTHTRGIHTFRWVVTLVQLSFTALSGALFAWLAWQNEPDRVIAVLGYGAAAVAGGLSAVLAVVAAVQRIRIELSRRTPATRR